MIVFILFERNDIPDYYILDVYATEEAAIEALNKRSERDGRSKLNYWIEERTVKEN